jgi:hypothetical protein
MIWHLCDGSRTVAEISALLVDAFPDEGDSVARDVAATLGQLQTAGSIVVG